MSIKNVIKSLITQQDIAYGEDTVVQTRGDLDLTLDKVRTIQPVNSLTELNALDTTKFKKAALFLNGEVTSYSWNGTAWVEANKKTSTLASLAALRATVPSYNGQIFNLQGMVTTGVGVSSWYYDASDTTSVDDGQAVVRNGSYRFKRVDAKQRFGSFTVVVDTTDLTVRDTLLPIFTSYGFPAALAIPLTSLGGLYNRMTLSEIAEYCRANSSEVLSHSTNGFQLDSTVATSVGESWIRTSKFELVQCGFKANGYVAINSVLDSKFLPELKRWFDYAFINSSAGAFPALVAQDASSNMHDLWRVSLEAGAIADLQACADYAKNSFTNIVFYTHASTTNLAALLSYCQSIGLKYELPSTWFARVAGLTKQMNPKAVTNLLLNSAFLKQKTTDIAPISWSISSATMTGITAPITYGEDGGQIDINATAPGVDNRLLFSQNYQCGIVQTYTPFCFSFNAYGLDATNTIIRVTLAAKDVTNATITSCVRDYTIRGDLQLLFAELGVCAGGTAVSYIQCLIELRSIAAGAVRALIFRPQLTKSGVPLPYNKTNLGTSFFKLRKNVQGAALAASTDNLILFDNVLAGSNDFYDMATGTWLSNDGGKYIMSVTLGLKSMVAGDRMTIKLFVGGSQREQVDFYCLAGQMIGNCIFEIPADGATYQIYLWHNSASARLTTTGHDATLSITRVSN
ncbi:hypothetical protein [Caudoviricetes sp.]|nr:hypothetical protein [Caudoviricetes sp.]